MLAHIVTTFKSRKERREKKKRPSSPAHLGLDGPRLPRQLVGGPRGEEGLVGARYVADDGLELAQQRGGLAALGLDLVKEGGVARLRRLQAGVELALLGRQVRRQVGGQDVVWGEEVGWAFFLLWFAC
ncbi:hypothetical protein GGTG_01940 [Gaeumannomyces tritici R3-111a-1]|uniref:Uncharacterized protein n=1 Tax=Gaeumannomyces tritici (strain R3-111a-1) TaxID=644352 RepID=J3NKZ9_GAET3|nr:hypothetical protein GGTG_01940 [Gaeumannomyces tritici R3-111a-1]EJT81966.1 hypothetical protein GGTG_01940 [Gaeumannomyces tritici R3-111a-1]